MAKRETADLLVGIGQIADYLGYSEGRARRLLASGVVPAFRVGPRVWNARKSTIDRWIADLDKRAERERAEASSESVMGAA